MFQPEHSTTYKEGLNGLERKWYVKKVQLAGGIDPYT